ncbi:restriction endonuclease subunit S [Sulfobacillus thermosulfidooxidans]|uniref:restriction endonuclease subunit S n=1 Tax=Sulfobacillus thermosulfidooxidans TaxID=28034 RepID=UPI0006B4F6F1|nr:restriction endonuclease subunit S [Sulfobacillus thermosulfidooxidans]
MIFLDALADIFQGIYLKTQPGDKGQIERVVRIHNLMALELRGEFIEEELIAEKMDRFRVREGQIIVSLRGFPLKASVVGADTAGVVVNSNFAVLTLIKDVDPFFLVGLLRSVSFNRTIRSHFSSSGVPSLKLSQLKKFAIPLVSDEVQRQMGMVFRAFERYQTAMEVLLAERGQQVESYVGQLLQGGLS